MKNIIFIALTISLLACETLVDDLPLSRFPELKSKLVLTSFISPQDTAIAVTLSQSVPLFGAYPKPKAQKLIDFKGDTITVVMFDNDILIADAQVIISDGKQSAIIPFDLKARQYLLPTNIFPIEAGKTYTLSAKTKDLYVEASTTVPKEYIEIENVKIDSTYEKFNFWESNGTGQGQVVEKLLKVINLEFDWKDQPQIKNYYKVECFVETYLEYAYFEKGEIVYKKIPQRGYATWDGKNYNPKKKYLNDENLDGKPMLSPTGKIRFYPFNSQNGSNIDGKFYPAKELKNQSTLYLKLFNVNKEFYQNQLSLESFFAADGNPFAEPVQVYSNVKDGLGCFGAYNISILKKPID